MRVEWKWSAEGERSRSEESGVLDESSTWALRFLQVMTGLSSV